MWLWLWNNVATFVFPLHRARQGEAVTGQEEQEGARGKATAGTIAKRGGKPRRAGEHKGVLKSISIGSG